MNEAATVERIRELLKISGAVPTSPNTAAGTAGSYEPTPAAAEATLEGHLDALRVQVRYLLFDLEATRRENRYLRQMLQGRRPGGAAGEEDGSSS